MHEASDEEAENTHRQLLRREDQTAQCSAVHAENIAHSRRLRRAGQTAWGSAAAIKKSSQVPPAAPAPASAPTIGGYVTRSEGKVSAEALGASATVPFTSADDMESPQRDHWKRAMEEESTSSLLNNNISTLNSREAQQLQVKLIGSMWVSRLKTILMGPQVTKHSGS